MSEGTMLDYETHIRPGCKLLNPNTLCDINKEVLPYGKVIFHSYLFLIGRMSLRHRRILFVW